ncbi:MAG TPA: site-specific integrase [Humisphaera sp.]
MHLITPKGRKRKYDIRLRIHDGRTVKIPGDREKDVAVRLGNRIESLVKAKANGDPPPFELRAWIDNMPEALSSRLVELGLLDQQRLERLKPLTDHIDSYEKVVAARKSNTVKHAKQQAGKVRRLVKKLNAVSLADITEDRVLIALIDMKVSVATRRHYLVAAKDFAKWMVKSKKAINNPLADVQPPSQYAQPTIERVPLTVEQFQKLMAHLGTFERYPHQFAPWNAADRKLVYWTAVKTGYRQGELRSLRVRNVLFDAMPVQIVIKAGDAKNRTKGAVPIPDDLAVELKKYVRGRDLDEPLFPFPRTNHGIVDMFRRDLNGAGIRWDFGENNPETVDFHTLRSTAITWWLDVDGLPAKRVQVLARLKTLALVAAYSRNMRLEDFSWLNKGPSLMPTRKRAKRSA